jgi:hypothetical protein
MSRASDVALGRALLLAGGVLAAGCKSREASLPPDALPPAVRADSDVAATVAAESDAEAAPECALDASAIDAVLEVRDDTQHWAGAHIADYTPSVWLHVTGATPTIERKLFAVPDIEPIDGCHAEVTGGVAAFACARGDHPTARLTVTAGGLELTITRAASPLRTEIVDPGRCARVSVKALVQATSIEERTAHQTRYLQWSPTDARQPEIVGPGFDPFKGIARDHRAMIPARAPERCADAGPGPTVVVELVVPTHPGHRDVVLSVPSLSLRESLELGGDTCEARVYPRSAIAVARCYSECQVVQRAVFVEHDELLWRRPHVMHSQPEPPPVLLPCHATVRFVVRP